MSGFDVLNSLAGSIPSKNDDAASELALEKKAKASRLEASFDFKSETRLFREGEDGGQKVFVRSIEASLNLKLYEEAPEFTVSIPSPSDVANTILGFVENRIQREIDAGADSDRIDNLLSQARQGIEAGYSSAEKDIEALGLMTEKLAGEIVESRKLVDDGVDNVAAQALGVSDRPFLDRSGSVDRPVGRASEEAVGREESAASLNPNEFFPSTSRKPEPKSLESLQNIQSYKYASHESSEFYLTTNDGDKVSIRLTDTFASVYRSSNDELGLALSGDSSFEFSVEGELDKGELEAINQLLTQVSDVAGLFFEDRFQEAFESALHVGFDASEIASFSLDLTKSVSQELRSYGEFQPRSSGHGGDIDLVKRYQPIMDMTNHLAQMREIFEKFEAPEQSVQGLIEATLERVSEIMAEFSQLTAKNNEAAEEQQEVVGQLNAPKVTVTQFREFSEYVLLQSNGA